MTDHKFYAEFEAGTDVQYTRALVRDEHEILYDEPEFLEYGAGNDDHASPVDNMVASLGACQISVLKQCLEKARIHDYRIDAAVYAEQMDRDEVPEEMPNNTALRIRRINVDIKVTVPEDEEGRAERCIEVYDGGCIVGQSFRAGIQYSPEVSLVTESSTAPED